MDTFSPPVRSDNVISACFVGALKGNDEGMFWSFHCELEGGPLCCPLGKKGKCLKDSLFSGSYCPFGRTYLDRSRTKRAKSYSKFAEAAKAWIKENKASFYNLTYVPRQLVRVGGLVLLPSPAFSKCESVPFARRASFLQDGDSFLPESDFTVENLQKLCSYIPHTYSGEEHVWYQRDEVPKLLIQLKFREPALYDALLAADPTVAAKTPQSEHFEKKTVHPDHLPPGPVTLVWGIEEGETVEAEWDGEHLTAELGSLARMKLLPYGPIKITWKPVDGTEAQVHPEDVETLYDAGAFNDVKL